MIVRLSDSLSSGFVVATALLIGLWLSFFGIHSAITRPCSAQDDAEQLAKAVRLEPSNPSYTRTLEYNQQDDLEFPDSTASENPEVRISGTAWVDAVNLLPQRAEHHKP